MPYTAWLTVTTPTPAAVLKFMLTVPVLRTRTDWLPVFASVVVAPSRASLNVQEPELSVTELLA